MLPPLFLLLVPVILEVSSASPAQLHRDQAYNRTRRDQGCSPHDEYPHKGMCCKTCPEGTHVSVHCTENHAQGVCAACTPGENYLDSQNGEESCFSCLVCKSDQVMVKECTRTTNRICECKDGYYCSPGGPCEICSQCLRCDGGRRIKKLCTSTTDTVCEDVSALEPTSTEANVKSGQTASTDPPDRPPESKSDGYITAVSVPLLIILILIIILFVAWRCCKRKSKDVLENSVTGSTGNNSENASLIGVQTGGGEILNLEDPGLPTADDRNDESLVNKAMPHVPGALREHEAQSGAEPLDGDTECEESAELGAPCQECGKSQPCDRQWSSFFYTVIDSVHPECILELVRKLHLHKASIDQISKDNPNNCREQNFMLLSHWRDQKGQRASMKAVLNELKDMDLGGCCENIVNNLRAKKIPIN